MKRADIGFVCVWDSDRDSTWSHIPANLLAALSDQCRVLDIEAEPGSVVRRFHHKHNRIENQPEWAPRPWNNLWRQAAVTASVARHRPKSLLQINDLVSSSTPNWIYRDMTWAQVLEHGGDTSTGVIDPRVARRAHRREVRLYRQARGVFTFSAWAARSVQDVSGAHTVVVPPGINVPVSLRVDRRDRSNLLFVGRAFERKGGYQAVRAFDLLRHERPGLRLHVVGPSAWPSDLGQPPGVVFHGPLAPERAAELFREADLFVMPSEFEAYGIAFLEAITAGIPCVARSVCAVPEILDNGSFGRLCDSSAPAELARHIIDALDDDDLYRRVRANVAHHRRFFSWERAAAQMLDQIRQDQGSEPGHGRRDS